MRALIVVLAGCWTGPTVSPPPAPAAPTTGGSVAEVRAIRRCRADGPHTLILHFRNTETGADFEVELAHAPGDPVPRTIVDGPRATFSPCHSHGCSIAMLTLDELVIGTRARGRYRVDAKAGPSYAAEFEAKWIGKPWAVVCPRENI